VQRLPKQCWPEPTAQALPQLPQLRSSLVVSTQAPLQLVSELEHDLTQDSCWQIPLSQELPQNPQFLGSLRISTHVPPQSCWVKLPGQAQNELWQV
jgi:hypothetical protein